MGKFIRNVFDTETLILSEFSDGYYLTDRVLKMNIAVHAKSEQDACIKALLFYQRGFDKLKFEYDDLKKKVQSFLSLFNKDEDYE